MSALSIAAIVVAVLVGLWLLKVAGFALVKRGLERYVAKTGACESCFTMRRNYLCKVEEGAPLGICQPCAVKKLGGVHGVEMMLKGGRLVRVET